VAKVHEEHVMMFVKKLRYILLSCFVKCKNPLSHSLFYLETNATLFFLLVAVVSQTYKLKCGNDLLIHTEASCGFFNINVLFLLLFSLVLNFFKKE